MDPIAQAQDTIRQADPAHASQELIWETLGYLQQANRNLAAAAPADTAASSQLVANADRINNLLLTSHLIRKGWP